MHIIRTRNSVSSDEIDTIIAKKKYRLLTIEEYDDSTCNKPSFIDYGSDIEGNKIIIRIYTDDKTTRTYLTYTDEYLDSLSRAKVAISSIDSISKAAPILEFFNRYVYGK